MSATKNKPYNGGGFMVAKKGRRGIDLPYCARMEMVSLIVIAHTCTETYTRTNTIK